MAQLQWLAFLSLAVVTVQLTLLKDESESVDDAEIDPIYDFAGMFELVTPQGSQGDEPREGVAMGGRSSEQWPAGSWKAPKEPQDRYPGKDKWPVYDTRQCTDDDMEVLHYWALKQAKKRLPFEGNNGTFKTGQCYKNWKTQTWFQVDRWSECYQRFYNVSTNCAMCIGSVFNMATWNWSEPCYNFCHGRPARKDGSHFCWEDCQSCMWYVGHRLSICYGEPYDMVCRYAKELGREDWYKSNGINPKR